jgi:NH3-dependent NAD+ synthetase
MAFFLGLDRRIVARVPTAGLEPGQSDYKDLGYNYDVVELVTEGLNQGFTPEELYRHPQVVPIVEQQIAHYRQLFGAPKFDRVAQVVADVRRRHAIAKGKMTIIHPPAPDITLRYD